MVEANLPTVGLELSRRDVLRFITGAGAGLLIPSCTEVPKETLFPHIEIPKEEFPVSFDRDTQSIWNSGAIGIFQTGENGYGNARAYLAYDEVLKINGKPALGIYTINHVIRDMGEDGKVDFYIPYGASKADNHILRDVPSSEFRIKSFLSEDPSVVYFPPQDMIRGLVAELDLKPMTRISGKDGARVEGFVATPSHEIDRWSVYEITQNGSQDMVVLRKVLGEVCSGLSGSPWILCEDPGTSNKLKPKLDSQRRAMVVAETHGPWGSDVYINPRNKECSNLISANKVR